MSAAHADVLLADYFAPHSANREIFRADLDAAAYVLRRPAGDVPDTARFTAFHRRATERITGKSVDLALLADDSALATVLLGWTALYRAALGDLQARYPASEGIHLTLSGTNWSERLGIAAAGLITIDQASRYAEYWAQQSLTNTAVQRSLQARMDFVDSVAYRALGALKARRCLLVYDGDRLGTTSYDLAALARLRPRSHSIRDWLLQQGRFPTILSDSAALCLEAMSANRPNPVERVDITADREAARHLLASQQTDSWLAQHLLDADPKRPVMIARNACGRPVGALLAGALTPQDPPTHFMTCTTAASCWALLDELRKAGSFQRLYCSPNSASFAAAVFPNQPVREVWELAYAGPTDGGQADYVAAGITQVTLHPVPSPRVAAAGRGRIDVELRSESLAVASVHLLPVSEGRALLLSVRSGTSRLSPLLALSCAAHVAAQRGLRFTVLVEARNEQLLRDVHRAGFARVNPQWVLDEWYFVPGASQLKRSEIPTHAAPSAAGTLVLRDHRGSSGLPDDWLAARNEIRHTTSTT